MNSESIELCKCIVSTNNRKISTTRNLNDPVSVLVTVYGSFTCALYFETIASIRK